MITENARKFMFDTQCNSSHWVFVAQFSMLTIISSIIYMLLCFLKPAIHAILVSRVDFTISFSLSIFLSQKLFLGLASPIRLSQSISS